MHRFILAFFALLMLAACGGGGSSSSSTTTPPPSGGAGGGGSGTGAANPPVVVNVNAGQTAAGVDISAPAPASSPAPNATLLGAAVAPPGGGNVSISLDNTGTIIHRGNSVIIALIGDGLSGNMTVSISGPPDITVDTSTIKGFTSTSQKPGISFQAAVSSNAGLGARTILLKNAQDDITSFTGGLEVQP